MKHWYAVLLLGLALPVSAQNYVVDKADANEKIYRTPEVDQKPQLKGGMLSLSTYIGYNYKFPDLKNKKVKIFTSFIVEPDGSMSDVRTFFTSVTDLVEPATVAILTEEEKAYQAKQVEALKTEAVRVLDDFDEKWSPALYQGKAVRCLYNYPINFNIE